MTQRPLQTVTLAMSIIKHFESCKLIAYPDPETNSAPWTIGWGTTKYYDGQIVKKGDKISQELADDLLEGRIEHDFWVLTKRIPCWKELSPQRQAALLSFSYNVGVNWYQSEGFNTITKRIANQEFYKVPSALLLYVNPGGPTEYGLLRRRIVESMLWTELNFSLN